MSCDITKYPILASIDSTEELRLLPKRSLIKLCDELRHYLLNSVSNSGGHFASGLGAIELTIALHYVYDTPFDQLIWDVGHQAYPHKIITGRRDKISTIRQKGGLHPFPWREESKYDVLSVGHSSTSISAGIGIAVAANKEDKQRRTVCVIGDGAITAGIAFEAMNHAGYIKPDILVILNDNEMSISENVGALNNHLAQILSNKVYSILHNGKKRIISEKSLIKNLLTYIKGHIKNIITPNSTLFEKLGFNYIGPINGHDVLGLVYTLKNMRKLKGPQFLHIITKKGYGHKPAERDPITFHAVPKFDLIREHLPKTTINTSSYSKIFGDWLCEIAAKDSRLIAITPAMREGSGMLEFSKKYPDQYFDVAISEQHAVTYAAGLAIGGYKPVVSIYSTFLQRAYDQVIHDVAIQKLPVLFAIDRAGIVGADGPTHQGAFDISYLRCIPGMIIMTPSDENECRKMLYTGYNYQFGPTAVRYPRGNITGVKLEPLTILPIGKGIIKRYGKEIAILNFGVLLSEAEKVARAINATLVDMRFVKPLDEELLLKIATTHSLLVTLEENTIIGGAGSSVNEALMAKRKTVSVLNLGIPDQFILHGAQDEMRAEIGLDATGIETQINRWMLYHN